MNTDRQKTLPLNISVVIPVYNTGKYLPSCLDSVLSQSMPDFEVLAVNDASTDDSPGILADYAAKDPRIRIINHECNKGLLAARISGIKAASGKYIQFLDSDDSLLPGVLRDLFDTAEKNQADIVHFPLDVRVRNAAGFIKTKNTRIVEKSSRPWHSPLQGREIFRKFFVDGAGLWMVCQKFYRSEICRRAAEFIPDRFCLMAEDFCFYTVCTFLAERYVPFGKPGYAYYLDSGISSGRKTVADKFLNRQSPFQALRNVKDFLVRQKVFDEYRDAFEIQEQKLLGEYVLRWMRHLVPEDRFTAFNGMFRNYDAFPLFRAFRAFFGDKDERLLEMLTGEESGPVSRPGKLEHSADAPALQEKHISPARWREWENVIRNHRCDSVILDPDPDPERLLWDIRAIRAAGADAVCRRTTSCFATLTSAGLNFWLMEDRVLRQASLVIAPDEESAEWYRKRNSYAGISPDQIFPPQCCSDTAAVMLALERSEKRDAYYRIDPSGDGETFVPFFRKLDHLFRKLPNGFRKKLFAFLSDVYNRIRGE